MIGMILNYQSFLINHTVITGDIMIEDLKLYDVWRHMIRRCENPNSSVYKNYGGRGIRVCESWVKSRETFYLWAMLNGYKEGLQIDRVNNDGGYEPSNCWFTTSADNGRNRRSTKLTLDKALDIRELYETGNITHQAIADMFGVHRRTVSDVLNNKTWRIEQ